ncbi:MAG: 3D domain-containing protein [Defluviitaleaceae bacterium]|nr:3D domain-containing protein [Defluviitaleaceae bacterium]
MKKYLYALAGLMLVFAVFITTANAMETEEIAIPGYRVTVTLVEDGMSLSANTELETIGEFLDFLHIRLNELDQVTPSVNTVIEGPIEVEILRAFPVYLKLDGAEEGVVIYARPNSFLLTFVNDLRVQTGLDFIFDRDSWQNQLEPHDIIELTTVKRVTYDVFENVDYETIYTYDDELLKGTREVYQFGALGGRQISTQVTYIGGIPYSSTVLLDEMLWQPINAQVNIGTHLPPGHAISACGEVFAYTRAFLAEATAYTLDFASTGRHPGDPLFGVTASGMMAQVGVVAVDTNVIPFHTRLYIEGYGFAIAGDRGGAIRGDKVDLFFDTREEVFNFGRRHINVWILDEIE